MYMTFSDCFYKMGIVIALLIISISLNSQELIRYDRNNTTAKIHYNKLHPVTGNKHRENPAKHPMTGMYSPTSYALVGVRVGTGICNYIYLPTNEKLKPGEQYRVTLTIKIAEQYEQLPYYQDDFGIALTSDLFDNHWGLWAKDFVSLEKLATEELVKLSFDIRPLCTSEYFVLGVFQGVEMDDVFCNVCTNTFELHSLGIEKSPDPSADFYYICDAYKEEMLDNKFAYTYDTDTIYFDSGSAVIDEGYSSLLDSIPVKLRGPKDLVSVYAYTDSEGDDNDQLGAARNTAVVEQLIKRGIDTSRILIINYGETKAARTILKEDRRVEIDMNLGKLYQKHYTEALDAAAKGYYGIAHGKLFENWMRCVPPENAIYSLFDCWGDGEKADIFRRQLIERIKSKYYRAKNLKFLLDSMYVDNQISKGSDMALSINRLPTYQYDCVINADISKEQRRQEFADKIYAEHGFPLKGDVGLRGNKTIPDIIVNSNDLVYLKRYLPLVKDACNRELIRWNYYSELYDKISVIETGFQRYGTQVDYSPSNSLFFSSPIEDVDMIDEYRRQVKLVAYNDEEKYSLIQQQKNIDKELVFKLNQIYQSDQKYRNQTYLIEQQYGINSIEVDKHMALIKRTDSLNLIVVKNLIDNRGWIGPDVVGVKGSNALFLVIQHSDLKTQVEYLPIMKNAEKRGDIRLDELALLEDRIAVQQGQQQVYGTQVSRDPITGEYYVPPISDPQNVNKRRALIGLVPIKQYLKRWNINWDPIKHKEKTINN